MKTVSVTEFWDALKAMQLFRQDQIEKMSGSFHHEESVELAKELIREGHLTAYQSKLLLQGRGNELVFDKYIIVDRLGAGSMGEVYKAKHRAIGRMIAMKVLRPDLVKNDRAYQRFTREMRAMGKLSHPNIVNLLDADNYNGTPFLAMEFVPGRDLASLMAERGKLPVELACDYIRQAALGLQHAFEQGITHRDLKPSNLLLTSEGVIKLLDMGLARLEDNEDGQPDFRLTRQGTCIGTPDYIAPEQVTDSHGADVRADIYSLGCTLYHLLAGEPPFKGLPLALKLVSHQTTMPAAIETVRTDVPPKLAAVLLKLLAKKPEDRYQTPELMAAALEPFSGKGVTPAVKKSGEKTAPPLHNQTTEPTRDLAKEPTQTLDVKAPDSREAPAPVPVWQEPKMILAVAGVLALVTIILVAVQMFWNQR